MRQPGVEPGILAWEANVLTTVLLPRIFINITWFYDPN